MSQSDAEVGSVVDERDQDRFVVRVDGEVAQLLYEVDGERLLLIHTEVPHSLGGRGLGGLLVRAAIERAAAERLTIVPWCPFARRWLRDHPEASVGVTVDYRSEPPR
jgi:uncharacterized protein